MDGSDTSYVMGSPALEKGESCIGSESMVTDGPKSIGSSCAALLTVIVRVSCMAAGIVAEPGCVAVMTVVPSECTVTRWPFIEATAGSEDVYVTGNPEDDHAIRLNGS